MHGTCVHCVSSGVFHAQPPMPNLQNELGPAEDGREDRFSHVRETLHEDDHEGWNYLHNIETNTSTRGRKKVQTGGGSRVLTTKLGIVGRFWSSCYRFK